MAQAPGVLLEMKLPCDEHAPGDVREALAALPGANAVIGDAMLVASELVTNAVRHSDCDADDLLEVEVAKREDHLVISVLDPGASGRTARPAGSSDEGFAGLGLMVVEQLVSQWGEERSGGYRVWARLWLD